jgi:hypothetical protein
MFGIEFGGTYAYSKALGLHNLNNFRMDTKSQHLSLVTGSHQCFTLSSISAKSIKIASHAERRDSHHIGSIYCRNVRDEACRIVMLHVFAFGEMR